MIVLLETNNVFGYDIHVSITFHLDLSSCVEVRLGLR